MYYKKTKREKVGRCNICLKTKKLTWDHVPPKGCSNYKRVEISSFFEKLAGRNNNDSLLISQNGLKYRTICKDCNSLLGDKYDDELNKLVNTIIKYISSNLILPPMIKLKVIPLPIIKSVVGHILAAKKQLDEVKYDNTLRDFVLDENATIPDKVNLFYWIYPFENTIVMRDFMMPAERGGDFGNCVFFQLLKFFPIAFLITEIDRYQELPSLTKPFGKIDMKTEIEIPIYLNRKTDRFWPEEVDNNNIVFASKETGNSVFVETKKMPGTNQTGN
jgi:hypothetical protein